MADAPQQMGALADTLGLQLCVFSTFRMLLEVRRATASHQSRHTIDSNENKDEAAEDDNVGGVSGYIFIRAIRNGWKLTSMPQ